MDIPLEYQQLNACFRFIRPSTPEQEPELQINTPLGISFLPHDEQVNDHIFSQLNFPNLKRTLPSSSPPSPPQQHSPRQQHQSPAASFLASFLSPVVTEEEPDLIDDYLLGDIIGLGGFSIVRTAQHQHTQEIMAVKIIQHERLGDQDLTRLHRELNIWRSLQHPNILRLQKVLKEGKHRWYLFSEYCAQGTLFTLLEKETKMSEERARLIFRSICKGVRYLHIDRQVVHKDLKLENVLLNEAGHVKICDFGLTLEQRGHRVWQEAGGSLAYVSPEQIRHEHALVCPKTDIWSLGIILYALVVGALPFMDTYDVRLQEKILCGQYQVPDTLSVSLKQVISGCLTQAPEERWDIDQILNSTWLKK